MSEYKATFEQIKRMPMMEAVVQLSDGNPGAITVLKQLLMLAQLTKPAFEGIFALEIRGSDLWVGYKDVAGGDINKFVELLERRSPTMMKQILAERTGDERKYLPDEPTFTEDLKQI